MKYSLLVRPEAQADVAETQKWYEERAAGLGRQFVEAVDEALASIIKNPLAFAVVRSVVRRALTKRFPYGILYLGRGRHSCGTRNSSPGPRSGVVGKADLTRGCSGRRRLRRRRR